MWALIAKDFRAFWMLQVGLLAMVMFGSGFTLTLMLDDGGYVLMDVFVSVAALLSAGSAFLLMRVDDMMEADSTFASLPLRRASIVRARFVTVFVQLVLSLMIVAASVFPAQYLRQNFDDPAFAFILHPVVLAAMAVLLTFMISIALPFYFAFGFGKGAWAAGLFHLGIVLVVVLVDALIGVLGGSFRLDPAAITEAAEILMGALSRAPRSQAFGALTVAAGLLIAVSLTLSVRLYSNRDL